MIIEEDTKRSAKSRQHEVRVAGGGGESDRVQLPLAVFHVEFSP